jgi:hypothetical protein
LETTNGEVDLSVGGLERVIGVAPFWRWWWRTLLAVVVVAVVVVLATTIITSVVTTLVTPVVATIVPPIVAVVFVAIIAVVVVASVVMTIIAAIVAVIIMVIPIVVATVGSSITVITSIRSLVTVVLAAVAVLVIIVVALGLLGLWKYPEGALQLFTLPHGVLGVAVKLAQVVHDHVEVTFKEGGGSGWIGRVDLAGSLARPAATIVVIFSVEVVHHRVLSIDKLVNIGYEVGDGVGISFMDLLEELDVGDSLLVVGDDVFVFDTCESVVVLKVEVSVLLESFVTPHPHSSKVMGVARTIVGRLVVGREEP